MNPLRELRARLRISKAELARKVGKSEPTIEKYEAELPAELARSLGDLANNAGHQDLKHMFDLLSGQKISPASELDLKDLDPDERELVELVVSMYRRPSNELEKTAVQLLRNIRGLKEKRGEPLQIPKRKKLT